MQGRRTILAILALLTLWPATAIDASAETPEQFIARREPELAADDVWGHLELADIANGAGLTKAAQKHAAIVIRLKPDNVIAREIKE